MINKRKVIKGLNCCASMTGSACAECPYKNECNDVEFSGSAHLCADALKLLEAEIERLKRPDCEHANHDGAGCLGYCGCEQDDEPIDACKQCEKYTGNVCVEY